MNYFDSADGGNRFICESSPASGKTKAASYLTKVLFERDLIDVAVVIAPQNHVVRQWNTAFIEVTGRFMARIGAQDEDLAQLNMDMSLSWAALTSLTPQLRQLCQAKRVFVIHDENHHASTMAAWGRAADAAFQDCAYTILLTGTPIRSDGIDAVYMSLDDSGRLNVPENGIFRMSYGEAVRLGYCRPTTFHRHYGDFEVAIPNESSVRVGLGEEQSDVPDRLEANFPGLSKAVRSERLIKTLAYEGDGRTPDINGYLGTMVEWGSRKLDEMRKQIPNAGGLIIAQDIAATDYFSSLIYQLEGERPVVVHSELANASSRIEAFSRGNARWIISPNMVSEGTDIPRLRVLVYSPTALTELYFSQAHGRIIRNLGEQDTTRAYMIIPALQTFESYARGIEGEMNAAGVSVENSNRLNSCSICGADMPNGARECPSCGYSTARNWPANPDMDECSSCGFAIDLNASRCGNCNQPVNPSFQVTLNEAERAGAIVQGIDLTEDELLFSERIAENLLRHEQETGSTFFRDITAQCNPDLLSKWIFYIHNQGLVPPNDSNLGK